MSGCFKWHDQSSCCCLVCLCVRQKCDSSKHKVLVVSVCPQSLPFFAVKFHLDLQAAAQKLCGFLKSVGESVCDVFAPRLTFTQPLLFWVTKCTWQCLTLTGSSDQWLNGEVLLPVGKLEMFYLCLQEWNMCLTQQWLLASASWRVRGSLFSAIDAGIAMSMLCQCSLPCVQVNRMVNVVMLCLYCMCSHELVIIVQHSGIIILSLNN